MDFEFAIDDKGKPYLKVYLSGYALLNNPLLGKGTAFTRQEREDFSLLGLIPPCETTLAIQCARSYQTFLSKSSDIEKYVYLRDLQDSNEIVFYKLLTEHISELMPIVYTPVVGLGCQRFSHIYRRPRGLFISYPDRNNIDTILSHPRFNKVQVIVVSDGERILGLGDQGVGGMGISIGKLALYCACAGIHPAYTLPILLDSGTDNPALLNEDVYLGWHHERVRGEEYDDFIDKFVKATQKRFPHVVLQWEDFAQQNANSILNRYRNELCTFNDDIQGTAAIAVGALLAAIHVTKIPLHEQRVVIVGAGSAGCGISNLLFKMMIEEGLTEQEARRKFFLIDQAGLLIDDMPHLLSFQKLFAQPKEVVSSWRCQDSHKITLMDVVENVHPTLLIGTSGMPGVFNEKLIKKMAEHVERPVIFPLSNPTSRSEATPTDLMNWTNERVVMGTGSPFADITKQGKSFRVDQTNNCYIFPGVGLGLITVKAKYITDKMFIAAAKALAECSPAKRNPEANLLPPFTEIHDVSLKVALAVAKEAIDSGLANSNLDDDLEKSIKNRMWIPEYLPYRKA